MKEIAIVGSYSNTKEKLRLLEECINECKKNNLDVLVYGRYPIPQSTQKLCDYWIFDKSNPVLEGRLMDFWNINNGKKTHKLNNDFGFAAIEQIIKSLGIVKSFNYESAYWINYDVDMTNFKTFIEIWSEKQNQYESIGYEFYTNYGDIKGINTTILAFKINSSYEKLKGYFTITNYYKTNLNTTNFAEHFIKKCFELSELSHYIMDSSLTPPSKITTNDEGLGRRCGIIPETCIKTRKYFQSCFIGEDSDTDKKVIFISNIEIPIKEILFNIGENIISIDSPPLNEHKCIEIVFNNEIPTKLEVLSINGDIINEELDEVLDGDYWRFNKIESV
jgi:hypothetical protein